MKQFRIVAKCCRHTDCQMWPGQRKSATTCEIALKNIIAGISWLNQTVEIEHRAAFVERISLKRATPARPHPTPAKSPFGPLNNPLEENASHY